MTVGTTWSRIIIGYLTTYYNSSSLKISQMPSSTRQATPGPSSTSAESRDYPISTSDTKKRAGSEDIEDAGHTSKKIKVDGAPLSNLSMNAKHRKKKRNRKKKRSPVVVPQVEPKERVKSNSRTPSSKPISVRKEEIVMKKPMDDTKDTAQCNEKPPPKVRVLIANSHIKLTLA